MQYLAIIFYPEREQPDLDMKAEYIALSQEGQASGLVLGGNPLALSKTAKCVRVRQDKTEVTDGPFIETKEQLGGYFLLECDTEQEALEFASKIPDARTGTIEVRPIGMPGEEHTLK